MTVWITGCAGFLGRRLARSLRAAGHRVVGLSRRPSVQADISVVVDLAAGDTVAVLEATRERHGTPEVVIHAAAQQPAACTWQDYARSNVMGTAALLDSLHVAPPLQFILTSTHTVYGPTAASPVAETAPVQSTHPYGLTKRWSEQMAETFQDKARVVILRLPSLFGAGQADSLVDGFARLALKHERIELYGCGGAVREALYVDDVVAAVGAVLRNPPGDACCVMNLGCGQPVTTLQFARALVTALGSRSPIELLDRPTKGLLEFYTDIRVAQRLIGFRPTPLAEAIKRYVDELRTQS